ncbi:MAG: DUF3999 family protein [Acidobacteriaceae bacterium]|nr:DUF3999 family protein [Acidobacteriaceae bacterium]
MKAVAILALLLWQATAANLQPDAMRYQRTIRVAAGAGQACAVLDAAIFPHATPSLTDLRIFTLPQPNGRPQEIPYAITLSQTVSEETQPARLMSLGRGPNSAASAEKESSHVVFDLAMPPRAYSDVILNLDPQIHDFLATATVSGSNALGGAARFTPLGSFPLFDLTSQRLSRNTTLPLAESSFRFLHVALDLTAVSGSAARLVPAMVQGAQVPPSRDAQSVYTTVAETHTITTNAQESRASFFLPPRLPIERVSIQLAPDFNGNFSRRVRISAIADSAESSSSQSANARHSDDESNDDETPDQRTPLLELVTGEVQRVHLTQAGRQIHTESLSIPAILGANLQRAARLEVAIENDDDQPLPIAAVRLEMRQRKICFEAPAASTHSSAASISEATLVYGNPDLPAPTYDYERSFVASSNPLPAQLGPEQLNPRFRPTPAPPPSFLRRHPELLWIALTAVFSLLAMLALRFVRKSGI